MTREEIRDVLGHSPLYRNGDEMFKATMLDYMYERYGGDGNESEGWYKVKRLLYRVGAMICPVLILFVGHSKFGGG